MDLDALLGELRRQAFVTIDRSTLDDLLGAAELIREDDTLVAGKIRVLAAGDLILLQEETPEGQVLVRRVGSTADGERLVEERLQIYERMWDGCGCKVDYYADDAGTKATGGPRRD